MENSIEYFRYNLPRKNQNCWSPSRLIINNYWLWNEVEFYFVGGRLFLNGRNASGKSNALAAAITLCLDGEKERKRMDTMRSSDKRIQDYIIGPLDVNRDNPLYHDERTSYIALEFVKLPSSYISIGIGLKCSRARQGQDVDFWGFILDDGRRIGKDYQLYQLSGGKRYPLSYQQLKNELKDPSKITRKVSEYKKMVNDTLFGFPHLVQYNELMNLLINLRSPQLSSHLIPSTVSNTLCMSLPPIDSAVISNIHEILRTIDEYYDMKQQRRQQREKVMEWEETESNLARYRAQLQALRISTSIDQILKDEAKLSSLGEEIKKLEVELVSLQKKKSVYGLREQRLIEQLKVLRQHEVFKDASHRQDLEAKISNLQGRLKKALKLINDTDEKIKQLEVYIVQVKVDWDQLISKAKLMMSEIAQLLERIHWLKGEDRVKFFSSLVDGWRIEGIIDWEQIRSELISFRKEWRVEQNVLQEVKSLFSVWKQADTAYKVQSEHAKKLQQKLREADDFLNKAIDNWDGVYINLSDFLSEWLKSEAVEENIIPQSIQDEVINSVPDTPDFAVSWDRLLTPVRTWKDNYRNKLQERILEQGKRVDSAQANVDDLSDKIEKLRNQKELDPDRRPGRIKARELLMKEKIPYLPLYAVCKPRDSMDPETVANIESLLDEMGLLDALVIPEPFHRQASLLLCEQSLGDAWIKPVPQTGAPSLWDYLEPDRDEGWAVEIEGVLRSIRLDGQGPVSLDVKSGWRHGILHGTANDRKEVLFLGFEARERRRQAEIKLLQAELEKGYGILEEEKKIKELLDKKLQSLDVWWGRRDEEPFFEEYDKARNKVVGARVELNSCRSNLGIANKLLNRLANEKNQKWEAMINRCKGSVYSEGDVSEEMLEEAFNITESGERNTNKIIDYVDTFKSMQIEYHGKKEKSQDEKTGLNRVKEESLIITNENEGLIAQLRQIEALLKQKGYESISRRIQVLEGVKNKIAEWFRGKRMARFNVLESKVPEMQAKVEGQRRYCTEQALKIRNMSEHLWEIINTSPYLENYLKAFPDIKLNREDIHELCKDVLRPRRQARDTASMEKNIQDDINKQVVALQGQFHEGKHLFIEFACELEEEVWSITLILDGRRVNLRIFSEWLQGEVSRYDKIIQEKERDLFENYIMRTVGDNIKRYIVQAQDWVEQINLQLKKYNLADGEYFQLKWRERNGGDKTDQLSSIAHIILQPALNTENQQEVISLFKQEIDKIRELEKTGNLHNKSFFKALEELFDYRSWYEFAIFSIRKEYGRVEIRDEGFGKRSGAQKALCLYMPLLSAAMVRYTQAREDAPRIIGLDEAFAGVDDSNIREVLQFMVESGFSWIITSEKISGEIDVLPSSITYFMVTEGSTTAFDYYLWDGTRRADVVKPLPIVQAQLF